ncbi:HAD hydrolase-like protein [Candidatus Dependentiae bacterium]|nr:HAD hydrolase-like protein [Candidatus Dependentiae bacterium]
MQKPILIFDFDGTIADTMKVVLETINEITTFYRIKKITAEDVPKLRHSDIRKLLKQINLPIYKWPFFIYSIRKEIEKDIDKVSLFDGIKELLITLKKNGFILAIITNNSKTIVDKFLTINEINFFDYIDGGNFFSYLFGKNHLIDKFLKKHGVDSQNAIYIGDEVSDIEAARKSNVKIISVCWGYEKYEKLIQHNPDHLAKNPEDVLKILKEM